MAVFMLNDCKFNDCGLTFKTLEQLIQHIEETHIDYDPNIVEQTEQQQPSCIPLSYALRFFTDAARKAGLKPTISQGRVCHQANALSSPSLVTRNSRNNAPTPTGSEAEEGDEYVSEPEDSNDSWTTSEEFSADFILRYGSSNNSNNGSSNNGSLNNGGPPGIGSTNVNDKPFACPVPGCKKRYKNVNGIKYHSKNGHKKDGKIRKAFRCPCGKSYKTPHGLKNHAALQHPGSVLQIKLQNGKSSTKSHEHHHNSSRETHSSKSISSSSIKLGKALAKAKVAAIEDHGYIKSEKPIFTDPDTATGRDSEHEHLGVLTPASTPPLSLQNSARADIVSVNNNQQIQQQQQQQQHERSLHKYLPNGVAASQSGVGVNNRRNVNDNN